MDIVQVDAGMKNLDRLGVTERDRIIANQIKKFAGWAKDMSNEDVILTAIRARQMGVHPLNERAFQAYIDRGKVQVDYHYSIITKYVTKLLKIRHTNPRYFRLTSEQLEEEGLTDNHIAYYATFILNDDLENYYNLIDRIGEPLAYEMIAKRGIGSVLKSQWNGQYFAPNGRSKAWKVQKRALKDAYVKTFGYPSASEAAACRMASAGWPMSWRLSKKQIRS